MPHYTAENVKRPYSKEATAEMLNEARRKGFYDGCEDARRQFEEEHKKSLMTNRNAAIGQAVELLQEASKMMSRAGYLIDKANGVR